MATRRLALVTSALALGFVLTGCSNIAENVAERAIEQAAEADGGGDVDLDFNDEDGNVSITSSEGSFSMGSSEELPEGFPADLPLPEDSQVVSSMSFSDGGDASFNVSMSVPGDAPTVAEDLQARLEPAGYAITGTSQMDMDGLNTRMLQFEGHGLEGFVNVADTSDGTVANYTVSATTEGS